MSDQREDLYDCGGLPNGPVSDLELVAHFRRVAGDAIVDHQIASLGSDPVLASMRTAHRAHLAALALTPAQLHRRAELLEQMMDEFGVPSVGADPETPDETARVQMFSRMLTELTHRAAEASMASEEALRILYGEHSEQ